MKLTHSIEINGQIAAHRQTQSRKEPKAASTGLSYCPSAAVSNDSKLLEYFRECKLLFTPDVTITSFVVNNC